MPFLKSWLLGMTAAALAVALAQVLTPDGTVKRVSQLSGGLLLLLATLRPLLQMDRSLFVSALTLETSTGTEQIDAGQETLKILIADKAAAYIAEKGVQIGCQASAVVLVQEDESGWPIPWAVEITGIWTDAQRETLRDIITGDLDIPTERQIFRAPS